MKYFVTLKLSYTQHEYSELPPMKWSRSLSIEKRVAFFSIWNRGIFDGSKCWP